jgi:dTDP-4-dehydrorhamnose reductase
MKIVVIGKNGQLGKSIFKLVKKNKKKDKFYFISREDLNLESKKSITSYFNKNFFDIIINCAAYTKVDDAEKNFKIANKVNHLSVLTLAKIANNFHSKLIHISTDYVFSGKLNKNYKESDIAKPINVYGKTKLAGEKAIKKIMKKNSIIIRSSWIYSEFGKNFLKTIIKIATKKREINIVNDQFGSPTNANDLAVAILKVINNKNFRTKNFSSETYHFSNTGTTSWHLFAEEIFKLKRIKCKINQIKSFETNSLASRPKNTSLNINKIVTNFKIKPNTWKKSLKIFFIE